MPKASITKLNIGAKNKEIPPARPSAEVHKVEKVFVIIKIRNTNRSNNKEDKITGLREIELNGENIKPIFFV